MRRRVAECCKFYPGWTVRLYLAPDAPGDWPGVDVVRMPRLEPGSKMMAWRVLAADDADAAIFRDADSVIGQREADAVAAWITAQLTLHEKWH
jgi:hypothetical protein